MTAILSNQLARTLLGATIVLVVFANLAVKLLIEQWLTVGESWWLVEDAIGLERVDNRGIAFGIEVGSGLIVALIVALALLTLVWLVLTGALGQSRPAVVAAGLITGGAIANALDRLPDGAVTDYIALWSWPRFNVADAALTIGIAALILIECNETRYRRP